MLTQNSKLLKTSKLSGFKVMNFGIPAKDTCLWAKECKSFCYASKGAYTWGNVKPAFQRRLEATKQDNFCVDMIINIIETQTEIVRIHDSGDFYSREYLHKWFKIMESLPHITFYAYSKALPLFENEKLPVNFMLIKSFGGHKDNMINVDTDRHAKIFKTEEELLNAGYVNASNNDLNAIGNNIKIGLIAH